MKRDFVSLSQQCGAANCIITLLKVFEILYDITNKNFFLEQLFCNKPPSNYIFKIWFW